MISGEGSPHGEAPQELDATVLQGTRRIVQDAA